MSDHIYPVCVIGGGSAGTMAALRTVLNNDECLFFPGSPQDKKRSRALWVRKVENMPAHLQYKRGIEDPNAETIKWIQSSDFAQKLVMHKNTGITAIVKEADGTFLLTDSKNIQHRARYIILSTGVMDVQPLIQGTIETVFDYANAQTIDYCLICDGHHVLNKKTSVIGHDNSAAWVAVLLYERYQSPQLAILTNGHEPNFEEETKKLIELYKIQVLKSPIVGIQGDEKGKILRAFELEDGQSCQTEIAFVALGMIVYNELAKQLGAELDERGFVKSNEAGLTSVPGLYVAGDLRANTRKQIYTAWDSAVSACSAINQRLRIERRQQRINSSKV
jgi:thioredoxin reductase (NADPH)